MRTEGNINNKCCSATGIGRTALLNCSPNPMKAQSCIPTPTSILISTPKTKEQGSNFDQWAVHENRLLFYKAVQLASIGGLNQRFHFHTTFGVPENMDHRGMLLLTRARPKTKTSQHQRQLSPKLNLIWVNINSLYQWEEANAFVLAWGRRMFGP